jgi:Flp pilus assembly protein TadG
MKKAFPIALMVFGLVFIGAGLYTANRGFDAKDQVRDELIAQNITTPDDASMPNARVDNPSTARSMADIIDVHARESSGGLTYAEMGRFVAKDGDPAGTSDEAQAVVGADGRPVANPMRNTAFQASALRTSLYTSVMAFNVADLVVGLGAMMLVLGLAVGGIGIALGGLAIPALGRRLHVDPVAAHPA